MKKIYWLMIIALIICISSVFALENLGYHHIQVEDGTLFGKSMGNKKDLAVLLVAGSGPTDMNGNSNLVQGKNNSFLYLAKELSQQGISTFRYDKRSAGKSADTFNQDTMDYDRFVDDCIAVIRYLKISGYKKIVIMGHSQGSLTGMLAAMDESIDGFISIGGTGNPIDITLERQLLTQYDKDSNEIQVINSLREGKIDTSIADDHPLFSTENQKFLLSWMKYNPSVILKQLEVPVFLIQGEADLQADITDFEALKAGNEKAETLVIPQMNHVLKQVSDDKENIASYTDPIYPLNKDLTSEIVRFINDSVLD